MQLKSTTEKLNSTKKMSIKNNSLTSEDERMQKKVDLQLYLHFERLLEKSESHYDESSSFFDKKVSKEQFAN